MDAFESVVGEILHRDGYWIQNAVKVELTKEEKREIGRPSSPRWELDLVAYNAKRNELLVVECKSFLDSGGVAYKAFDGSSQEAAKRYKLFNDETLRRVVFDRLRHQMCDAGFARNNLKNTIKLALVCGKIVSVSDRDKIRKHFENNEWILWDNEWLQEKLKEISEEGYENSQVAIVSKLLLRTT